MKHYAVVIPAFNEAATLRDIVQRVLGYCKDVVVVDDGSTDATPELVQRLTKISGGRTSADGADTAVWLASAPELERVTNKFFEDREEVECQFRNKKDEEKLWWTLASLTAS